MNREDSAKVGGWLDHASKMARTVAEHNAEETIAALTAERDNALAALRRRSSQRDQLDARVEELVAEREALRAAISSVRALHQEHEGRCVVCVEWCDCLDKVKELGDDYEVAATARLCTHGNVPWPCPTIAALDSSGTPPAAPTMDKISTTDLTLAAALTNPPAAVPVDFAPVPEERRDEPAKKWPPTGYLCLVHGNDCPGHLSKWMVCEDAPERSDEVPKIHVTEAAGDKVYVIGRRQDRNETFEEWVQRAVRVIDTPSVSGLPVDGETT